MKNVLIYFLSILLITLISCNSEKTNYTEDIFARHLKENPTRIIIKLKDSLVVRSETSKSLESRTTCADWQQQTGKQDCCYAGAYLSSPGPCKIVINWNAQSCLDNTNQFHCWIYKYVGSTRYFIGEYVAEKDLCFGFSFHTTSEINVSPGVYKIEYGICNPSYCCYFNLLLPSTPGITVTGTCGQP